jgi:CRISPR-associated protein Csb1
LSKKLTYELLLNAVVGSGAALRSVTKLQPVGGEGDRVFPATYAGAVYATEKRRVGKNGAAREVDCVLLNSVPSEANHAEEALLNAISRGKIGLPLIEVDFSEANSTFRKPLQNLTSLEVPHRLADAILRDTLLADGTRFSKSNHAAQWSAANLWNATPIYRLCPTALVFGMWGSPEKPGGLGAKFERAYVSEIVAVDIDPIPRRRGFRIDPIGSSKDVPVKLNANGGFDVVDAKTKGAIKPSELNHGNILIDSPNGGVRCQYAEQTTVISLGALRKLRFPLDGKQTPAVDDAARTVLAAIGLCAAVLSAERGTSLRSRCHLWPVEMRKWELLDKPGATPEAYQISGDEAVAVLNAAIQGAEKAGLQWMQETLKLKPAPEMVEMIRQSQEAMATKETVEEQ